VLLAGCGSGGDPTTTEPSAAQLRVWLGNPDQVKPKPGARKVTVPDVVGIPSVRGAHELRRRGLYVSARFPGRLANPSLKPECGYVYTHQSPAPGQRVPVGSTVIVIQDLCPKYARLTDRQG
jgi:hypothetical protein